MFCRYYRIPDGMLVNLNSFNRDFNEVSARNFTRPRFEILRCVIGKGYR